MNETDRLLRREEVEAQTGLSRSTIGSSIQICSARDAACLVGYSAGEGQD